ncbi:MAG: hypothetical protein AB8B91_25510 [Rubripirellula sp.]
MPSKLIQLQLVLVISVTSSLSAQSPAARRDAMRKQQQQQQRIREIATNQTDLPTDPQLLSLHKEFITKAEKLALEYERKKQLDKAREVYESLVRLVPKYSNAEQGLNRVLGNQKVQDRKLTEVKANQAWQDTGVNLLEGMPVRIKMNGTWKVVYETGPKGIEIPNELRPKDGRIKLGTMIALIANSPQDLAEGRPFVLESDKDFIAKKSGRLYLRMFDVDPSDNEGKIVVMIQSTFQ